ncbi:DUF2935 domain-containing protein [Clostridium sp. MSJ-11]|uniref:DUF2935 domain-containing protein n=1 Tax=Clostridium mobile TaxID=2841512 RepID=A0ABS6EHD3_9CLOT|nr:DUF2935 domain-containing protein [Clostridium mobile]
MLSSREFVRQSLELNLFFMRIAKEHAIFLQAGLVPKDHVWASQADMLKDEFSQLLIETIKLSQGIISPEVANSGELVTDLTFPAERETEFLSGIEIDSNITRMEEALIKCPQTQPSAGLERRVSQLNRRAIAATKEIICFKTALLDNVLACEMFTTNYPLLIDHILREAKLYLRILIMLQNRQEVNLAKELAYQENFWNRIMAEHAKFIRGLLDPTEVTLFDTANDFGKKFDALTAEAKLLMENLNLLPKTTEDALKNTIEIRDFKRQGTEGILDCTIRIIALPLLGDHVLREANHYIRLLKSFKC